MAYWISFLPIIIMLIMENRRRKNQQRILIIKERKKNWRKGEKFEYDYTGTYRTKLHNKYRQRRR